MAAAVEAFKRGDAVLSKFPGGSIMMVLGVEGLKVRCADGQNIQYWFDSIMLERYQGERRDWESMRTIPDASSGAMSSLSPKHSVAADGANSFLPARAAVYAAPGYVESKATSFLKPL